jgi:cupin fold WbuC family metalloprotein
MQVFSAEYLSSLATEAQVGRRRRQHRNVHQSFEESCQRLFNAIEPDSYIRPHKHGSDPKGELLVAVRGSVALIEFDDSGGVSRVLHFGARRHDPELAVGVEVAPHTWHTVIATEPGSILLEVKAGPFDPSRPKDLAPWAPEEHSAQAATYLQMLRAHVESIGT